MRDSSGQNRVLYLLEKFGESLRIRPNLPRSELQQNTEDQLRLARIAVLAPYDTDPSFICENHEWSGEELALANAMLPRAEQLTPKETQPTISGRRTPCLGAALGTTACVL